MLSDLGPGPFVLAFDVTQMKPGCALLQSTLGGTPGIASVFAVETWLLVPTADMQAYEITKEQLEQLVARVDASHRR